MDVIDENQMVFVDASNGEESIELVDHSLETEASGEAISERKDIVEVQLFVLFEKISSHHHERCFNSCMHTPPEIQF